jgi:rhomboid protease GluP
VSDERERAATATPYVTYALIVANVIAFALELVAGADLMGPSATKMIELGGDYAPRTLNGEWWRLVSSMFLHYGVPHLLMNMLVLFQGRLVEIIYGRASFIVLYLASGLFGGLASLWHAGNTVSAGASGAVFGVFGAFGAFLLLRRGRLPADFVAARARSRGTFIGLNLLYGASQKGIDLSAHIGGLIGGFGAGAMLLAGRRTAAQHVLRTIAIGVVATGACAAVLIWMPHTSFETVQRIDRLFEDFARVERETVDRYNGMVNAHTPNEQFADVLEKEIEPTYVALSRRFDAEVGHLTARQEKVQVYAWHRIQQWDALIHALRDGGEDAQKASEDAAMQVKVDQALLQREP